MSFSPYNDFRFFYYARRHRGRTASYLTAPAYYPDVLAGQSWRPIWIASLMRIYRTGLFRSIRIRLLFEPLWVEGNKKPKWKTNKNKEKHFPTFRHFKGHEIGEEDEDKRHRSQDDQKKYFAPSKIMVHFPA